MKKRTKNKRNSGFTLLEVLVTVAIVIVLTTVSAVGVVNYIDNVEITELDNAAREIYMAAQNRAVLLSGNQQLTNLVAGTSGGSGGVGTPVDLNTYGLHDDSIVEEDLYYVSKTAVEEDLLRYGNIDPTLVDGGDFFIVYDLNSGSVTDVIYAKSSLAGYATNFKTNYSSWWSAGRTARKEAKSDEAKGILVGFYNGKAAASTENGEMPKEPDRPYVTVIIKNEEKLTVTVESNIDSFKDPDGDPIAKLSVRLGKADEDEWDDDHSIELGTDPATWTLDSLTTGEQKFKDLKRNDSKGVEKTIADISLTPGDDFKVRATVTSNDSAFNDIYDEDTDNSLFQRVEGTTAYIQYLRHLQNLSADTAGAASGTGYDSGVKDITAAIQTANIKGTDNATYDGNTFYPIVNTKLTSYKGKNGDRSYEIQNLKLTASDGNVGLFSTTTANMTISNVRMFNTSMTAGSSTNVGVLAGETNTTGTTTITDCVVYWVPTAEVAASSYQFSGSADVGGLVGKGGTTTIKSCRVYWDISKKANANTYQFSGANVGGLAGTTAGGSIENCSVYWKVTGQADKTAYLFKGTTDVGGLAGKTSGATTIKSCQVYWDTNGTTNLKHVLGSGSNTSNGYNYKLDGKNTGGLVGNAGAKIDITDSLAATMVSGSTYAGGLVGQVNANGNTITTSYADCYLAKGNTGNAAGLVGNANGKTVNLTKSYAAGFIAGTGGNVKQNTAGLCGGTGTFTMTNTYSALLCADTGAAKPLEAPYYGLAKGVDIIDTAANTVTFLGEDESGNRGLSAKDMMKDSDFFTKMTAPGVGFVEKVKTTTHPYKLRDFDPPLTEGKEDYYPYPGLSMDHYNDWGEVEVGLPIMWPGGLVYWEQ